MEARRVYLDNAATSWPKPPSVYAAIDHYQRELGAPAGRGAYGEALQVDRLVQRTRAALAELIEAPDPGQIVFTYSGTDALSLALRGLLRRGDHVITSVCEHNSVLRPLRYLEDRGEIGVDRLGCDAQGWIDPRELARQLRDHTRLVALVHASNVTGAVQPIEQISELLADHPAHLLVDAAQTVGHRPVSVRQLGCDLLAAPGHKGLLGPTGSGFLYLAPGLEYDVEPIRMGGTGSQSESDLPPTQMPDRYEAGNLNVAGIIGMAAGIEYLQNRGVAAVAEHERQLAVQLLAALSELEQVVVFGPPTDAQQRVGVVSFQVRGYDPQEVATLLDQQARVQVRAGFHCAPRMHHALNTHATGGTVRVSFGPFNQTADVETLVGVLAQLVA